MLHICVYLHVECVCYFSLSQGSELASVWTATSFWTAVKSPPWWDHTWKARRYSKHKHVILIYTIFVYAKKGVAMLLNIWLMYCTHVYTCCLDMVDPTVGRFLHNLYNYIGTKQASRISLRRCHGHNAGWPSTNGSMVLRGRKETLLNLVRGHSWQRATEAVSKLLEEVGVGQKTVTKQWYTTVPVCT